MRDRNIYIKLSQYFIILIAYLYLIYYIFNFKDWQSFIEKFIYADNIQYLYLFFAVILFTINILFEAIKWKYLLNDIQYISLKNAIKQTYFGIVGGFFTPAKLGDFPSRVTMINDKNKWITAISLGFIGSFTLSFVQIIIGFSSFFIYLFYSSNLKNVNYIILFYIIVILIFIFLIIYYKKIALFFSNKINNYSLKNTFYILSEFSYKKLLNTCLLSFLRYIVYCTQFYLLLLFCGVDLTLYEAFICISVYYMFITITPNLPFADVGIRGSLSVIIFSIFTQNTIGVMVAAILLWIINNVFPMIIGSIEKKQ